jgi:hypothetical protein
VLSTLGRRRLPVLVDDEEIEPIFLVVGRLKQADPILAHLCVEPFIANVADPVHGQFGVTPCGHVFFSLKIFVTRTGLRTFGGGEV